MREDLVRVEHLKKYFKTPKGILHAVDDVSFTIPEGTTLGVVGESGCGKSTLGRTVLRLQEPTAGKVWFDGVDIGSLGRRDLKRMRANLQMIFQDPFSSLDPRLSVSEAIAEPLIIAHACRQRGERERTVARLMDTVGLSRRFADSYPHELDGGRRQRIGIARALSLNPRFVVCDEPVSALDVSIQAQILNLLQDLQEERRLTYLFITHNMAVVRHISDAIVVMYLGRVVEQAPSELLFEHPEHPYTKALLAAVPVPRPGAKHVHRVLQGELTSPIDPGPGCRFCSRCPFATQRCRQEEPVLQDRGGGHLVACHLTKEDTV